MTKFEDSPYFRSKTLANAGLAIRSVPREDFPGLISSTLIGLYGKEQATLMIEETLRQIASVQLEAVPVQFRTNGDTT